MKTAIAAAMLLVLATQVATGSELLVTQAAGAKKAAKSGSAKVAAGGGRSNSLVNSLSSSLRVMLYLAGKFLSCSNAWQHI